MHWREEREYEPLLRRAFDAGVDAASRRGRRTLQAIRDGFYYLITLPGLLLFDWWERFRLADGWARFHNFLMGLPAFVLGAAAIFVAVQTSRVSTAAMLQQYHRNANLAAESGDSRTALLLFTRMREIDQNSTFATFEMARHYERLGKPDQAAVLLRELARLGDTGDPEAHRWLARMLLKRSNVPYATDLARKHLQWALQADENDAEANALMGQLALREGDVEMAHQYYTKASRKDGQFNVGLARSLAALGRPKDAEMIAMIAEPYFRGRLRGNPNDQDARVRLAEIHTLRADFPQAAQVLREGLELPHAEEISQQLARLYVVWGLALPDVGAERWRLWEQGFLSDPRSPELLKTLLGASDSNARLRGRVNDLLDRLRENPAAGVEAELISALLALSEQDERRAKAYLERAGKSAKRGDEVLADMARIRGLRQALATKWVELGLIQWPNSAALKRVKAELLANSGRYAESLLELNGLAAEFREDPTVHALLAEAYEKLGQPEQAAEHRRLAEPLLEVSKVGNGTKR